MIDHQATGTTSTCKEKAWMERQATDTYEAPELRILGTLQDLTQENFENTNVDFNQFGVTLTGTS